MSKTKAQKKYRVAAILHTYWIEISVQAEKKKIANPTFLDPFDLRVHMPGHFPP